MNIGKHRAAKSRVIWDST